MKHGNQARASDKALTAVGLLDRLSWLAIVSAMAIMAVTVVAQVVLRYLFSAGIDWSEELARLAFVWAMFLAIPHGIRNGVHVGIDVIIVRLGVSARSRLLRLTSLLGALLMALLLFYAVGAMTDSWSDRLPTLPVTVAAYYLPVALAAGHSMLNCILLVLFGEGAIIDNSLAEIEENPA